MARKKVESRIGMWVDPTNELAVKVIGKKIVVNSTQVSKANLDGLMEEFVDSRYTIVVVDYHPSQYTEPVV